MQRSHSIKIDAVLVKGDSTKNTAIAVKVCSILSDEASVFLSIETIIEGKTKRQSLRFDLGEPLKSSQYQKNNIRLGFVIKDKSANAIDLTVEKGGFMYVIQL